MAEPSPQDRFAAPGPPGGSNAAFPRWSAAQSSLANDLDPAPLLLPGPDESPAAYLARLKSLHARLGSLISTIERRREVADEPRPALSAFQALAPAPVAPPLPARPIAAPPAPVLRPPLEIPDETEEWPAHDRRARIERRLGAVDRRHGLGDRRGSGADARLVRTERRAGPRDRRTGPTDRRRGIERRRVVNSLPWERGGLRLNAVTMVWVIQVAAWVTIAVVALVYGLGAS